MPLPTPTFSDIATFPQLTASQTEFVTLANTFYESQKLFSTELATAIPWFDEVRDDVSAILSSVESVRDEVSSINDSIQDTALGVASGADRSEAALASSQAVALAVQAASGLPTAPTERRVLTSLNGLPLWLETSQMVSYVDTFTTTENWTKREGAFLVVVEAVGGGGAGASIKYGSRDGLSVETTTAGGGGGYAYAHIDAGELSETEVVIVGAGGISTATSNAHDIIAGGNGGDSSFAGVVAFGGKGGADGVNISGIDFVPGSSGGGGSCGIIGNEGVPFSPSTGGGAVFGSTLADFAWQIGGASVNGGGGGGSNLNRGGYSANHGNGGDGNNNSPAGDGQFPGGGGGLGSADNTSGNIATGGAGGDGMVKITTYCIEAV